MSEEQNGHEMSRLDRIERVMEFFAAEHEQFREEHRHLLTAQILLTDRLDKFARTTDKAIEQLTQSHKELAEAQKHTDQRMDALIAVVDGIIRKPPTN